jgi:hypothetical protein
MLKFKELKRIINESNIKNGKTGESLVADGIILDPYL